ncbi:septum site-determining protein Ssd [Nocardiopsis suaedae]|uniref:Histidine kinase n=1 Tax=Nocardiopsis suaedae TaxID=3018444 RepID=A0ABT4TU58_9ACTN|nr:septum site-determining protein Ssd [Nocardiopsis suaedae]MDA2808225.1 histidine kinase [Nocardiopsis suaedae]
MERSRPLLATDDPELLDDLLRLAAAASVEVDVAASAGAALRDWARAPLVVVGGDLLAAVADLEPPPHPHALAAVAPPDPGAPAPEPDALRAGVRALLRLPGDEARLTDLLADAGRERVGPCPVVAAVGGRGGAGASVLAAALAMAGVRAGLRTALVDADPLGPGLDLVCGGDGLVGTRWGGLLAREGRMSWPALSGVLPQVRGCPVVTWDSGPAEEVPAPALRAVLGAAALGGDLVVVDAPREPGPGAVEALRRCTAVLVVVPADFCSVMAAYRLVPRLRKHSSALRLVTRGAGPGLPAEAVASSLGLEPAGNVPEDPRVRRALDRGDLPGADRASPLARAADRLLEAVRAPAPTPAAGPS